jgi:hypothetical protein
MLLKKAEIQRINGFFILRLSKGQTPDVGLKPDAGLAKRQSLFFS